MAAISNALLISGLVGVVLALVVLYLYARKRLREGHLLFWLLVSISIVVLSWSPLILVINALVQASNPTYLVLAGYIMILMVTGLYLTMKVAELSERLRQLAFALALEAPAQKPRKQELSGSDSQNSVHRDDE